MSNHRWYYSFWIALVLSCTQSSCQEQAHSHAETIPTFELNSSPMANAQLDTIPYNLTAPIAKINLPKVLEEVSAINHVEGPIFAMVQDEDGIIFLYDSEKEEIVEKIPFAKPGDYEGLATHEDKLYVLRSDGRIFELTDWRGGTPEVVQFKPNIPEDLDYEGLCWDPGTQSLLIAGKEPLGKGAAKSLRAVFSYSPASKKTSPFLSLDLEHIEASIQNPQFDDVDSKWAKKFDSESAGSFKPSAIYIHPISQKIYMISATGHLLLALDRNGQILAIERLKKSWLKQPEGICFTPDGNLWITSEGKDLPAVLMGFSYEQENH
ncbi:SdiA-regulated domain-containing protein [Pontibacter sp. G13]|uniref:SdiA-regulated domain-containing protein n=1 Tax=Pontibacter sp. G13 TaxID=3074898 RepID=UPI0028892CD4|nr:SdiA-regulated domain-containing protein [Pontibacter sp. G13]WNJ21411.1 SdiA-regulated domain-containing protein [Pontibacter sp. G13]